MPYDIVGNDSFVGQDFVGADDYDEVAEILSGYDIVGADYRSKGAALSRSPFGGRPAPLAPRMNAGAAQAAALSAALQAKRASAGLLVNQQKPGASRRLVLGMASTGTVAAASIAQITARPQNLAFKPQRIVIPATIAPDFLITDIKVGNVSQLVQSGTLPAEAFTQQLFDGQMEMDTIQTSQDFVLQVQNIAGAARNFYAAVYGLALLAR